MPPSLDATILNYLSDSERGAPLFFVGFWRPSPPLPTPQYLTILMIERGGAIIFCRILAPPPMSPPSQTPQYFTILMTEREGAPVSFCRILAPPPPHDSKILYYLNDRDEGRYYFCRILAPPPPSPSTTILNYLNDRERGRIYHFVGF